MHEALDRYGSPEIFNTDQGSQFTSLAFTDVLTDAGIHISMDGKGRWMDNVFIERLWRSLKYEQVYLAEYATASAGISDLLAPDGTFIHPRAAERTKFCSAHNRAAPEAVI